MVSRQEEKEFLRKFKLRVALIVIEVVLTILNAFALKCSIFDTAACGVIAVILLAMILVSVAEALIKVKKFYDKDKGL